MCNKFHRYTQELAQQGLSILLAAWNVSQMAPASMMSSMISVQVQTASVALQPCAITRSQQPSGACCHYPSMPGSQVDLLPPPITRQNPFCSHLTAGLRSSLFSNYSIMVSGAVSVQPPLGDIPCYFRLSAQVNAAVEQSPPHQPRVLTTVGVSRAK